MGTILDKGKLHVFIPNSRGARAVEHNFQETYVFLESVSYHGMDTFRWSRIGNGLWNKQPINLSRISFCTSNAETRERGT